MDKKIENRIERLKAKAELFLNNNISAFIIDFSGTFHFCNINSLDELKIYFTDFDGKTSGDSFDPYWVDVKDITEYKQREESK